MTGASTLSAQILVDGWPEDVIFNDAWVEVCSIAATPMMALKWLEKRFPHGDTLNDGEEYTCLGEREFFKPAGTRGEHGHYSYEGTVYDPVEGPWIEVDNADARDTKQFWRFRVVAPAENVA